MGADSLVENTPNAPESIWPICLPKPQSSGFQWKKASLGVHTPWFCVLKWLTKKELCVSLCNMSRSIASVSQKPKSFNVSPNVSYLYLCQSNSFWTRPKIELQLARIYKKIWSVTKRFGLAAQCVNQFLVWLKRFEPVKNILGRESSSICTTWTFGLAKCCSISEKKLKFDKQNCIDNILFVTRNLCTLRAPL